jgi:acetyltransferase-like isoleucine patch superfamily enzyme
MKYSKRELLDSYAYPVLSALEIPKLLLWLMDTYRMRRCFSGVTAAEGVRFRASATVHNPTGDPSRIHLGRHAYVLGNLIVHDYGGRIEIGDYSYVGLNTHVFSGDLVKIGRFVLIAHNVTITDTNAHELSALERAEFFVRTEVHRQPFLKTSIKTAPVEIGDHAWLNFDVGVLRGVTIGEGAIIGAGSLVTKDVPPYVLAVGNPARPIRELPRDLDLAARLKLIEEASAQTWLSRQPRSPRISLVPPEQPRRRATNKARRMAG